jgi:release factor glutamine methyltransferase
MNLNCTWRDMMREAAQRLGAAGIENPARDARLLLAHALQMAPADVIAHELDAVDAAQLTDFERLVQRRLAGEPVSRIRGWREFYGRRFRISPDVLDPRPETELLVSEGLKRLPRHGRVLDLGTGSGCILISILAERPDAAGVGLDISPAALAIARDNARALRVSDRASFIEASWDEADPHLTSTAIPPAQAAPPRWDRSAIPTTQERPVAERPGGRGSEVGDRREQDLPPPARGRGHAHESNGGRDQVGVALDWQTLPAFDLVLSNPPYIAEADIANLAKDVRLYDPLIALVGMPGPERPHGEQPAGTKSGAAPVEPRAHRAILSLAPNLLKPGASIGLEFGEGQHEPVAALMSAAGLADIAILPDLAGIPRAAFGRRP